MQTFAAIDFETANSYPSSVCSVGVVIVRGGEFVKRFYSLIQPEPNYYDWCCQRVHGLSERDTDDASVFPYVWEKIAPHIEGLPLVAHTARFDERCLKAAFRTYQMDYPDYVFYDTLKASRDYFYIQEATIRASFTSIFRHKTRTLMKTFSSKFAYLYKIQLVRYHLTNYFCPIYHISSILCTMPCLVGVLCTTTATTICYKPVLVHDTHP